jgi:hypothetical protein
MLAFAPAPRPVLIRKPEPRPRGCRRPALGGIGAVQYLDIAVEGIGYMYVAQAQQKPARLLPGRL